MPRADAAAIAGAMCSASSRAEQAVLAGVRVEAAHGYAGCIEETCQRLVGQCDHVEDTVDTHSLDRLPERAMRADVGHGEGAVRQHHRDALGPAQLRDQLGVPDEARVGQLRRFLVHRHRDDARDAAVERVDRRAFDVRPRRGARLHAELAGAMLLGAHHP